MNSNKFSIKCIVILSAVVLLLCIICAFLTLDNHNNSSTKTNNATVNITQTQSPTQQINKQPKPPAIDSTPASTPPTSTTTTAPVESTPTEENSYSPIIQIPITPTSPTINTTIHQTGPTTTEQATATTESPTVSDEEFLKQIITHSGYTLSDIKKIDAEQLIVVTDYNSNNGTTARLFSLINNNWQNERLDCRVNVGSNGIGNKKSDIDSITPKGLYTIGEAFYIDKKPSTWLNTFKITNNTYWITDTESDMYNKKIELENSENTVEGIYMINSHSYRYGCVINYNTNPIIKGKGCAIFIECGNSATAGGIAFAENDLLKYLEILNSQKNPAIIIF